MTMFIASVTDNGHCLVILVILVIIVMTAVIVIVVIMDKPFFHYLGTS